MTFALVSVLILSENAKSTGQALKNEDSVEDDFDDENDDVDDCNDHYHQHDPHQQEPKMSDDELTSPAWFRLDAQAPPVSALLSANCDSVN